MVSAKREKEGVSGHRGLWELLFGTGYQEGFSSKEIWAESFYVEGAASAKVLGESRFGMF